MQVDECLNSIKNLGQGVQVAHETRDALKKLDYLKPSDINSITETIDELK